MLRPASHLRNVGIAMFATLLVLVIRGLGATTSPFPASLAAPLHQEVSFTFDEAIVSVAPDGNVSVNATLVNNSTITDTFTISNTIAATLPDWTVVVSPSDSLILVAGASQPVTFIIAAPATASGSIAMQATATGQTSGNSATASLLINVTPPTPTSTNTSSPTPSDTPTPSNTPSPTSTETPGDIAVDLTVRSDNPQEDTPGSTVEFELRIVNTGGERVTVDLDIDDTIRCNQNIPECVDTLSRNSVTLNENQSETIRVSILLPNDAPANATANTRVIAQVRDTTVQDAVVVTVNVIEATATPTVTPSPTITPSPTFTPSPTPTLGPVCVDIFEGDDDRGSAKVIDVRLPQPQETRDPEIDDRRAICPSGDEDWLVFGGVQGKVYTIDIRDVAAGLDLTLTLFDEDGNQIAFNDDFYDRDPNSPNAQDINPRIDSWIAPYTGRYYIQVRDAADRGGTDRTYRIELIPESYGETPVTVDEICEDEFEDDGLPEQARLITSNERQSDRRLCPTGDADWVTFFGKTDKRYFIYTDTRPYFDNNPVNDTADVQAGADTVLVLTDRDGVSVLDVNDDIPGGETLDSQIEFIPEVDGFYYIQIKNVGDIGHQFIRYDLTLELCIPNLDCGRDIEFTAQTIPTRQLSPTPAPTTADDADSSAETPTASATPAGE